MPRSIELAPDCQIMLRGEMTTPTMLEAVSSAMVRAEIVTRPLRDIETGDRVTVHVYDGNDEPHVFFSGLISLAKFRAFGGALVQALKVLGVEGVEIVDHATRRRARVFAGRDRIALEIIASDAAEAEAHVREALESAWPCIAPNNRPTLTRAQCTATGAAGSIDIPPDLRDDRDGVLSCVWQARHAMLLDLQEWGYFCEVADVGEN